MTKLITSTGMYYFACISLHTYHTEKLET